MIDTINNRNLCCSRTCEKRIECGRNEVNNAVGTYYVEDYSSFGAGKISNSGCEIDYWCGKLGDYKMFEPVNKDISKTNQIEKLFEELEALFAKKETPITVMGVLETKEYSDLKKKWLNCK